MILDYDRQPLADALADTDDHILDGKAVAKALREQLRPIVAQLCDRDIVPTLAVVQVGDDEASSIYIRHKIKACKDLGIRGQHHHLREDISNAELHEQLTQLSDDPEVHGILLQLPLPPSLDEIGAVHRIDPRKDVDGFHPVNLGCLMTRRALLEPCTPTGVITLLDVAGIDPRGMDAVVVGRSVIVGRPMAAMLTRADATVTTCHRHTRNLEAVVRRAELLVVATGVAELVQGDWIRDGAVVIDVGISRKDGKLTGDVEFDTAVDHAAHITPVPGGVGPMTVATVLENTVRATCLQHGMVVRDGQLQSIDEQKRLYYETVDGLAITRLRRQRSN